MGRRSQLSALQRRVAWYLLDGISDDGLCVFQQEDLCEQVGNAYPYNVFRQFIIKGFIDELPTRRSNGEYEVHIPDPERLRKAAGTKPATKKLASEPKVPGQSTYLAHEKHGNCFHQESSYIALHPEIAQQTIEQQILHLVLASHIDDEDEKALRNLIAARQSMNSTNAAHLPECILVLSHSNVTRTCADPTQSKKSHYF